MSLEYAEVCRILSCISVKMTCPSSFNGHQLRSCLMSLRNFSSDNKETLMMLNSFALKIETQQNVPLGATDFPKAIESLRYMNSDCLEVRAIVKQLGRLIMVVAESDNVASVSYRYSNVADILTGIQCMSSDVPEVLQFLDAIGKLFEKVTLVENIPIDRADIIYSCIKGIYFSFNLIYYYLTAFI